MSVVIGQAEAYPGQPRGIGPFRVRAVWQRAPHESYWYEEMHEERLDEDAMTAFTHRAAYRLRKESER